MDTIYKLLENCEVKKVGRRQYEFTASTADMDRDGEVIDATGWDLKNFKKNPVIMYAHDYRSLPIGKASRVWVHNGVLKNTIEFPPEGTYEFADIVEKLVDTGYLKTESVGFIPKKWEDGDGEKAPRRTYTKQELLEISIVPIPSNPDALRNAVEDGVITTKQFEAITKPEETDEFIRIPVRTCEITATIDISKEEGIKALYCGKEKEIATYLFLKEKGWTMAKARAWVKEHAKKYLIAETTTTLDGISIVAVKVPDTPQLYKQEKTSQEQIIDEIDYLKSLIEKEGLSREGKESFEELMRISGYDKPVEIEPPRVQANISNDKYNITFGEIQESLKRIGG